MGVFVWYGSRRNTFRKLRILRILSKKTHFVIQFAELYQKKEDQNTPTYTWEVDVQKIHIWGFLQVAIPVHSSLVAA